MKNREIDALIATEVMGWESPHAKFCGVLPEFSTDPAASKLLRQKMLADGWNYHNGARHDGQYKGFYATVWMVGSGFTAKADTEELTFSLAALKAYGAEVPE